MNKSEGAHPLCNDGDGSRAFRLFREIISLSYFAVRLSGTSHRYGALVAISARLASAALIWRSVSADSGMMP